MKYFLLLISLLLFTTCFSDGETKSKYSYNFHVDKEGESPQVGDKVIFREKVYLNKKEIFSTEEYGQKEIILPAEDVLTRPLPPNYEVLFLMSTGDSVSVVQKLKDVKTLPEGYETDDELKYVITLLEVISKENIQPTKKKDRTISNYPYELVTSTGNFLAQSGDRIRFREHRYINDSLDSSTPMDKPLQSILPAKKNVPIPPPGNYEALLLGGIGDSIHVDQLLENVDQLPNHLTKNDTIKYRIQILDVITPAEYEILKIKTIAEAQLEKEKLKERYQEIEKTTQANIEKFKKGELEDDLIYTPGELNYLLHEEGTGDLPNITKNVEVHYAGFLMDGTSFDNSYEEGEPIKFPLGIGRVIKGWDAGISKLPIGSKATFFIPYTLAYGKWGRPPLIPRRADLVFYIEVVGGE